MDAWNTIDRAVKKLHETYPKIPQLLEQIPMGMFHDDQLVKMGLVHRNPYPVLFKLMSTNHAFRKLVDTALNASHCRPTSKYVEYQTDTWDHRGGEYPWHETSTYCVPLRMPEV